MTIPIGLSPGFIKAHAKERTVANRRYPFVCGSDRHIEVTEITFPDSQKITKVPESKNVESDSLSYKSSYELKGIMITAVRSYKKQIVRNVCRPETDQAINELGVTRVINSDLRTQIFVE